MFDLKCLQIGKHYYQLVPIGNHVLMKHNFIFTYSPKIHMNLSSFVFPPKSPVLCALAILNCKHKTENAERNLFIWNMWQNRNTIHTIINYVWPVLSQASLHNRAVWPGSILLAAHIHSYFDLDIHEIYNGLRPEHLSAQYLKIFFIV